MNDTEPIYISRPILDADCAALARMARLSGDKTISPTWLHWVTGKPHTQSMLYEHEIDGVAHPIAWCLWGKEKAMRSINIGPMICHLEYDGHVLYQLMLGHIIRTTSPMYPSVLLEGVRADNDELTIAAQGIGFCCESSSVINGVAYLNFRFGVEV